MSRPAEPKRPAPGSSARRWVVTAELAGQPLDRCLRALLGESWGRVRRLIETGKIELDGARVLEATLPVRAGQAIELVQAARRPEGRELPADAIVYFDAQVVVVHKPSGVSAVPYDETERDALSELVARLLARRTGTQRSPLGIVHRLDKETSGLILFARTLAAKRALKNQFRFHSVERRYWAIAHGRIANRTLSSRLVADRGDGRRGSIDNPKLGRAATTHVKLLEPLRGASLIECRLETGRTHQIRIHLAEAGHPLLGERVYARGYAGRPLPAPRVMLHAFELGFEHPVTGRTLHFEAPMPPDMQRVLAELRG